MRALLLPTLLLLSALPLTACDKDGDNKADADKKAATDKKADGAKAPADAKSDGADAKEDAPKEVAEAAPEPPKMEPTKIEAWGVTMDLPAGAKLGEVEDGGGDVADTLDIDAEEGCGGEIELYRHKKSAEGVAEMFKNATGPSGNKDDQDPIKEQREDGYRVMHSWVIPLGDTMFKSEVGKVLGDHLYLCGAGTLMGVEKKTAECVLAACDSLKLTEG